MKLENNYRIDKLFNERVRLWIKKKYQGQALKKYRYVGFMSSKKIKNYLYLTILILLSIPSRLGKEMKINEIWSRYKIWIKANVNNNTYLDKLNPSANLNDVQSLEKKINLRLPTEFKSSLLVHDGIDDLSFFYGADAFLSLNEIYNYWLDGKQLLNDEIKFIGKSILDYDDLNAYNHNKKKYSYTEYDTGIKWLPFSKKWIPFMSSNGGTVVWYLDLDPDKGGSMEQIIEYYAEGGETKIVSSSYIDFLFQNLSRLEKGDFIYDSLGNLTEKDTIKETEKQIASNINIEKNISTSLGLNKIELLKVGDVFTLTGVITCKNHFINEINEYKTVLKKISFFEKIRLKVKEKSSPKLLENECFIFMNGNEHLILKTNQQQGLSKLTLENVVTAKIQVSKISALKNEYSLIDFEVL